MKRMDIQQEKKQFASFLCLQFHICDKKDFSSVIEKSLELGGYKENKKMTGINGGDILTVGYGHNTVLSIADKIIELIKNKRISHH